MKQYLTYDQTAKLIELGFEKPKGWYADGVTNNINLYVNIDENPMMFNYSISELIAFLPSVVEYEGFYYGLQITTDCAYSWEVRYEPCPYEKGEPKILPIFDGGSCLIDKLYEVLCQLVVIKDEFTDIVGHKEYGGEEVISRVFKLKEEGVI